MEIKDLGKELCSTTYPGRGIIIGRSADNKNAAIAYFIMGRSENSRNRIFEETDEGIRTKAFDESKMTDPSLIIYAPVRKFQDKIIVTNGDQTDTIYEFLSNGKTFEDALRTRTFEPDNPNFTPRISGVLLSNGDFQLSILKSDNNEESHTERFFFDYNNPKSGVGRFIHTYIGNGNPLPSFEGEPTPVTIPENFDVFSETVWNNLNAENKVSLYTCFVNLESGKIIKKIYNKNK